MLKLLFKHLKVWHYFAVVGAVVLIYFNVEFDLKLTELMGEIMKLLQTGGGTSSAIWQFGIEMLLYSFATILITILVSFIATRIGTDFSKKVRGSVFKKVNNLSTEEVEKFSVPSLITRTSNDIQQIQMVVIFGLRMLIMAPIMAVRAILKISSISPELSLVVAITVVAIVIMVALIFTFVYPKVKVIQKKTDELNSVTRESLTGVRVVRAHGSEKYQEEKFAQTNKELKETYSFVNKGMAILNPGINFFMRAVSIVITWVGASLILKNSGVQFSDIAMFSQYAMSVIMSFMFLIMLFILVPRAMVSAKRINEVLASQSSIYEAIKPLSLPKDAYSLTFHNVGFSYPGADGYVLKDINFTVNEGETLAIIGSTGSGKSTILNLIPRFFDASEGNISISGIDIRDFNAKELNKVIGFIPQQGFLFSGDIDYNIKYGFSKNDYINIPENEMNMIIDEALEISESKEFVSKLPDQLSHKIVQAGTNVSGGQRQRLAIARAIAKNPKIYLFDDSFSALDYQTDRKVRTALKKKTKHAINIIVAQRVGTIIDADKIIVLEKGVMVGFGTHKELLKTSKEYQEIAYSQFAEGEL